MKMSKGKWIEHSDVSNSVGRKCVFVYTSKRGVWHWLSANKDSSLYLLQITIKFQFQKDWSLRFRDCEVKEFWPRSAALTVEEKKLSIAEFLEAFPQYAEFVVQTTLVL